MIQKNTNKPNARDWLPEKKLRESIRAETFLSAVIAAVFTIIFVYLDSETQHTLIELGSVFAGIMLGFCINNCWKEWKNGDAKRIEAIKIDDDAEEEIQKISEDLRQQIHSLKHLPQEHSAESHQMVIYFLGQRQNYVQGHIHRMANEIRRLGYDYEAFLKEKKMRFIAIQNLANDLVSEISSSAMPDESKVWTRFIGNMGKGIQLINKDEESRSPNADNPKLAEPGPNTS